MSEPDVLEAHEEAARAKQEGLEVKLVDVDDLLHGDFKVWGGFQCMMRILRDMM